MFVKNNIFAMFYVTISQKNYIFSVNALLKKLKLFC